MRNYEVTFIVDPVLSAEEIKSSLKVYVDMLKDAGCNIVHIDEMGLRQLAYPIKNRNSGIYYCVEFQVETGEIINKLELALRRDERIMRFLTVKLDRYGVKYNEDKRNGLIKKFERKKEEKKRDGRHRSRSKSNERKPAPASTPKVEVKKEAPEKVEAVVAEPAKTVVTASSEEE